jgi:hypothetical protein
MSRVFGSTTVLVLSFVLGVVLVLVWRRIELGSWVPPGKDLAAWGEEKERARELDYRLRVQLWRIGAKQVVIEALAADQLTFLQAVAWFHRLNKQPADEPHLFLPDDPRSHEQVACEQAIKWQRASERRLPCRQGTTKCWEKELQQQLTRPGGLVLPEPPPLPGVAPVPGREE